MKRLATTVRPNWADEVRAHGLVYCYTGDRPYWDESAYYELSRDEVDRLEAATAELQRLCLEAGQHIIDKNRFAELGIPGLGGRGHQVELGRRAPGHLRPVRPGV